MRELQARIVAEMEVSSEIDPAVEVRERVAFLSDYLTATGASGLVLGISGGLDSTLAGRLAQLAVEQRRGGGADAAFVAMRLPHGTQHDEDDARAALEFIRPDEVLTFDVAPAVEAFTAQFREAAGEHLSDFTRGNTKARVRMAAQYAVAGERGLVVVGTDHGAESVTGFFTKFGDGAADVLPLFGLDKGQNRALLRSMGAPEKLWGKAPTADLLDDQPGRSDEDELGLTYEQIDAYLRGGEVPDDVAERIEAAWRQTRHKRALPVTPRDTWWR